MTTATITTPALPAGDPRHGTVAGRVAGCGCLPCRLAGNAWKVRRSRQIGYGTWNPWVDAEPVRAHLHSLKAYGIGWKQAATISGISPSAVAGLLYNRGKAQRSTKCRPATAQAILAIRPTIDVVHDRGVIDGTGTLRRLRALVALGHTMWDLGERLPMHPEAARRVIRGETKGVSGKVARAARDLYDELSTVRPEGWTAKRARRMAADRGWAPPLAWDDDTIDDPDARPQLGEDVRSGAFDEITVGQAVEGRLTYAQIATHRPDLIETVRRLAKTLTDIEIAHLLRWPGANEARKSGSTKATNSITKLRHDNGIPACTRPAVIPHRPHRRKRQAA